MFQLLNDLVDSIHYSHWKLFWSFKSCFQRSSHKSSFLFKGVKTTELDNLAAETAAYLSTQHPDYGRLAARIAVSNLQKETLDSFGDTVELLHSYVNPKTNEPVCFILSFAYHCFNDNPHRHLCCRTRFTNLLSPIWKNWRLPSITNVTINTIISASKHSNDRICWNVVDALSNGHNTCWCASHVVFIAATSKPQLKRTICSRKAGKCCIAMANSYSRPMIKVYSRDTDVVQCRYHCATDVVLLSRCDAKWFDRRHLLYTETGQYLWKICLFVSLTHSQCALISKSAGGIGVSISNIRASQSYIRGTNGHSNGLVPMLRVFNDTARYVDQGGLLRNRRRV